jgi:TIGR03009 family protein
MKTWIRSFGCLTLLGLSSHAGLLLAQTGYNTSGTQPQNPPNRQPQNQPNAANPKGGVPVALNPGLQQPGYPQPGLQPAADSSKLVVVNDPYADNPISPKEQEYLDQLLNYWEQNTKNIQRLHCEFKLFEFDSNSPFVQQVAQLAKKDIREVKAKASTGILRYMAPDKGKYMIDMSIALTGKLNAEGQPEMLSSEQIDMPYWICDGETIHDYDRKNKLVTHYVIPKELRGKNIIETPLPFLFGVEAQKVKNRYWVRALTPPPLANGQPNNDIFFIEAFPKYQQDAVNYSKVHIFLDRKEFLPVALIVYKTEHRDNAGEQLIDCRDYYEFTTREKDKFIQKFNEVVFRQEFIELKLPAGWKEETKEYVPLASPESMVQEGQKPPQGQTPFGRGNEPGVPGNTNGQGVPVAQGNPAGNNPNSSFGPAQGVPASAGNPPKNGLRK